ncbi:MAG: helix-turn-helix domain-containing protein [Defluviitaleaceae bacterium]|nr:helix-turn-helix domain-containing protein [Defluviitaleaceae bacterium]
MYYTAEAILKMLREQTGISQDELTEGIMTRANLSRIENGEQSIRHDKFVALLERMGESPEKFLSLTLGNEDHMTYKLREDLDNCLSIFNFTKADELIAQMEALKPFEKGLHKQYLLKSKATIYRQRDKDLTKVHELLDEAIKMTKPNFNEKLVHTYFLTISEVELIHSLASFFHESGETDRAIELLEKLIQSIKKRMKDAYAKARLLTFTLHSISSYLGQKKRYKEALALCDEAIDAGRNNRVYGLLPMLAYNKAYFLYYLGQRDKVKWWLYQAYFACINLGQNKMALDIKQNAKENFNVDIIL